MLTTSTPGLQAIHTTAVILGHTVYKSDCEQFQRCPIAELLLPMRACQNTPKKKLPASYANYCRKDSDTVMKPWLMLTVGGRLRSLGEQGTFFLYF